MSEENNKPAVKWYYKPVWIVIAILSVGPFALPLVWFNPALKRWQKIAITVAMIVVTIWLAKATVDIYKSLLKEVSDLQNILR